MRAFLFPAVLMFTLGCQRPQAQAASPRPAMTPDGIPIARSYGELMALLDAPDPEVQRAEAALDELDGRPDALLRELKNSKVPATCAEAQPPCGRLVGTVFSDAFLVQFAKEECGEKPKKPGQRWLSDACVEKYVGVFVAALKARYPLADADALAARCRAQDPACNVMWEYEFMWLESHDTAARHRFDVGLQELRREQELRFDAARGARAARLERRQRMIDAFTADLQQRQDLAAQEAEEAERGRRALATMGAAFTAMSQNMAGSRANYAPPPSHAPPPVRGCASDFECMYGSKCLKGFGQMQGACAQAVDQLGVPTFAPPSTESVMPGQGGDCSFDTECSIGFRCLKPPAQLRGFCVK